MEQPSGFIEREKENLVCLLQRSLYGLKQSPRQWYKRFDELMLKGNQFIYLLIYVDDMLIACKDKGEISKLTITLKSEFEMKNLGAAKGILGIDIMRDRQKGILTLSLSGYLKKVIKLFEMSDCKPTTIPVPSHFRLSYVKGELSKEEMAYMKKVSYSNVVGSFMYVMIGTRPDITHGVSLVSRFMSKPSKNHWNAVKWLLTYLKGIVDKGLAYRSNNLGGKIH